MGIYGKQTRFSDNQDFAGETAGGNVYSDNDLKVGPGDFGQGNDLFLDVFVTEAFVAAETASVQVVLVTDAALPVDDSSLTLYATAVIAAADLVPGYKFTIRNIPPGCLDYLGIRYVLGAGTDPTQGKIFASLTDTTQEDDLSF